MRYLKVLFNFLFPERKWEATFKIIRGKKALVIESVVVVARTTLGAEINAHKYAAGHIPAGKYRLLCVIPA